MAASRLPSGQVKCALLVYMAPNVNMWGLDARGERCTDAGRRLAALGGGPLRKLLGLVQEATTLVDSCCAPGESPLTHPPVTSHTALR